MKGTREAFELLLAEILKDEEYYSTVGTVVSVDETARTCEVEPVEGATLYDVRLQSIPSQSGGFLIVPNINSKVVVSYLNSQTAFINLYSSIDRIEVNGDETVEGDLTVNGDFTMDGDGVVTTDSFQFNGGKKGGLIILSNLVSRLNDLEALFTQLQTDLTSWVPVPTDGGAALKALLGAGFLLESIPDSADADFENTKIKH